MRKVLYLVATLALTSPAEGQKVRNVGTRPTPDAWVPVPALEVYAKWWQKNLQCMSEIPAMKLVDRVDIPRRFSELDSLKWFVAGRETFVNRAGNANTLGTFYPPDTIVLAGAELTNEVTVRHEMLHAMGWKGHPMVPFRWPCDVE